MELSAMNYSYDNRSNADNTKHDNNGRFASENTRQIGSEAFHDKSIGCMIYYNDRGQRVYDFSGNNTGRRRIPRLLLRHGRFSLSGWA